MSPTLIAHRGYPARFPENTLVGYRAAVAAGATWLETDVQFTRDGEPMLYHDADLKRTSNRLGRLADYTLQQLGDWDAAERDRFGERHAGEPIPRLSDFVSWLAPRDAVSVMIELKQESLDQFGMPAVTGRVLREMDTIIDRCVIISFSLPALRHARELAAVRVGWVLPAWDERHHELAEDFVPDFLIADHNQLPPCHNGLWHGAWSWVVYTIDDPTLARQQFRRGIGYVETNAIGELMSDKGFRQIDQRPAF
jgi:glycerophosphoryl diester phosphodiesterase